MNSKVQIIKNFSYSVTSNLTSFLISTLLIIIVPKLIGVEDYGRWQLYLFYASYVGFFQFGWNDGIYLRYGGKEYENLDKGLFFSQFWMLTISQLIIAGIIIVFSLVYIYEIERRYVLVMVAICLVIMGVRAMPFFILLATNRIKEYAQLTIIDRIIYCCLVIAFMFFGIQKYKYLIAADLIGKFISLLFAMFYCKDIVYQRISEFNFGFSETIENISVGIKLMFANIASILIIGVVRFGIEQTWNVTTFGKVSFTLSVSNLLMLFINALGIIIFPILRRTDENRLPRIYTTLRDFLMVILLGALAIYYPLKAVLSVWLPQYADSLRYMALVFPMCVFEGKMSLLVNTYLKTLRKEKLMLKINLISLSLSVIITFITTILFKNMDIAIASIAILLAFRCVLAELYISNILKLSLTKDIVLELMMTFIFIVLGWIIDSWLAVLLYIVFYGIYLFLKRKDIATARNWNSGIAPKK